MSENMKQTDVFILGASAAGLMCAIESGKRGRRVTVIDHANKPGKKILMSGGGRCNFTNYTVSADNYISHNPHFCKSALSRYTQWDFIAMVNDHGIAYHERDHGQLFCNDSAKDILNMLLDECKKVNVTIKLECTINTAEKLSNNGFIVDTTCGQWQTDSLVIASGGLSIPKMCASPIGYQLAEQFGHRIQATHAGLVPFTLHASDKQKLAELSGIAVDCVIHNPRIQFRENLLFTHRGLSGPAVLQISSYWQPGETIHINLSPDQPIADYLMNKRTQQPQIKLKTALRELLPKRLLAVFIDPELLELPIQHLSDTRIQHIAESLHDWQLKPNGTEGYRTAEVTLGGVDCDELSSKTMESRKVSGLYFIGEVVDVTGWLGGYNFQWAWSSGWVAGQYV